MNIEQTQIGNTAVVTVQGVIKMCESGKQLSTHLQKVLEQSEGSVLVDLSEVDEVDSTGLGELVAYLQLFSKQGRGLAVFRPTDIDPQGGCVFCFEDGSCNPAVFCDSSGGWDL